MYHRIGYDFNHRLGFRWVSSEMGPNPPASRGFRSRMPGRPLPHDHTHVPQHGLADTDHLQRKSMAMASTNGRCPLAGQVFSG
jgi:hypothetical protein